VARDKRTTPFDALNLQEFCGPKVILFANPLLPELFRFAGVMACPESRTKDGFETQIGTNYLGHFLLFELLKSTLLASSTQNFLSRVVILSSVGHIVSPVHLDDPDLKESGYEPWKAYGQSKTADIYLATEIERRYGAEGLHGFAVHPGGIFTPLQSHMSPEQTEGWRRPEAMCTMKSPGQGAATTVLAAIGKKFEGRGGKYMENCDVAHPRAKGDADLMHPGYAPHAYDEKTALELWDIALRLVAEDGGGRTERR
jgi:NAD(P)-dependent dehydrogenase (short-subunit alcohol dehydrogenase family)